MVKTTVYIDDGDAAALRRLAAASGRSQAEIIREAIGRVTSEAPPRRLLAVGVGRSGDPTIAQRADQILREEMGGSKR